METLNKPAKKGVSAFTLKMIAIITMLIDHIAAILNTTVFNFKVDHFVLYRMMRITGRIAMPLFVFMLVNGFFYTHNVKKYLARIGLFALLTEIPFDLAFSDNFFYLGYNSVMVTLFLGVCMMILLEKIKEHRLNLLFTMLILIGFMIIATILRTDYAYMGIFAIFLFYQARSCEDYKFTDIFNTKIAKALDVFSAKKLSLILANFLGFFFEAFSSFGIVYLSTIPMLLYNGKRGYPLKYAFYAFYPVHLFLLYLIRHFVIGGVFF